MANPVSASPRTHTDSVVVLIRGGGVGGGGKTHSMIGEGCIPHGEGRGIVARACEEFFKQATALYTTLR